MSWRSRRLERTAVARGYGGQRAEAPAFIAGKSHYYPFGMNHLGPWYETVAPENKYLYNGKELSADYEINLYEYGARWYDPAVGRFTGVDPIAEEFPHLSVYNYASNQPINNVDLHGLQGIDVIQNRMYEQYLQGKATEQDLWDMWEAQFAGGIAGLGGVGLGGLLKRGVQKVLSWALMNPEVATGAGTIIWGLGTDADVPGGGDDTGRVIRHAGSRIWGIPSITERGMTIEKLLGGNLPSNFPVIDKFKDGIATSIKSIDLTAKSYQEGSKLSKTINRYVDNVADFNGRSWGGVNISKGQIKGRALEVAVQNGKVTGEQWEAIQESVDYALKKNVNLSIKFVE